MSISLGLRNQLLWDCLFRTFVPEQAFPSAEVLPPTEKPLWLFIRLFNVKKLTCTSLSPKISQTPFSTGKGQYMYDENGKRYLDLMGGICTVSAGHAHDGVSLEFGEMSKISIS